MKSGRGTGEGDNEKSGRGTGVKRGRGMRSTGGRVLRRGWMGWRDGGDGGDGGVSDEGVEDGVHPLMSIFIINILLHNIIHI